MTDKIIVPWTSWKLFKGELIFVYIMSIRSHLPKDALADNLLWGSELDGDKQTSTDMDDIHKSMAKKFTEEKVPVELLPDEWKYFVGSLDVYLIQWPSNVSKLLFRHFLPHMREYLERTEMHGLKMAIVRMAAELAKAIDQINEEVVLYPEVQPHYEKWMKLGKEEPLGGVEEGN